MYRGGAVKGHAPTNLHPKTAHLEGVRDAWRFDKPGGLESRRKGSLMSKAKGRERQCLEAMQNGRASDKELEKSFPPGMVKRLRALITAASDHEHRHFINAQRIIHEILRTLDGGKTEQADGSDISAAGMTVRVITGRVDVPMPGEPGAPVESEP